VNLTPQNKDMKTAAEILEKHLLVSSAYPLSDLQKHFVLLAMEEYASQFLPPVSEEEINEWIDKYAFRVPYDGSNKFYNEIAVSHCNAMKNWLLSRLPQREPVGKTDKLEVEQSEENKELAKQPQGEEKEATTIIENLMAYGRIHTISNVVYMDGSHEEILDRAERWLNNIRKKQSNS